MSGSEKEVSKPEVEKITPAEARAMVRKDEELFFETCPHCNERIAIYLHLDTTARVNIPKAEET